jgi:hypothetical protein
MHDSGVIALTSERLDNRNPSVFSFQTYSRSDKSGHAWVRWIEGACLPHFLGLWLAHRIVAGVFPSSGLP